MSATILQNYWWFLISLLGALLVFLLFVQGGQSMLLGLRRPLDRNLVVNVLGRKWELTFTTLVVFGGAFFASFPLFYSTSFGGAYWLWMLILFSFVVQAFSYEFRRKSGNLYGTRTYDVLLFLNGLFGSLLLGVAVGTMIFGAEFTVNRDNILDPQNPVISVWANPLHGLEAIANLKCLCLGVVILLLARIQGAIYLLDHTAADSTLKRHLTRQVLVNALLFVPLFLVFVAQMLMAPAYVSNAEEVIEQIPNGYLRNYVELWWAVGALIIGVVLILTAIIGVLIRANFTHATWYIGAGTVLVVMSIFWVIGYNGTSYYPSLTDMQSSLTLTNSSSSPFTLKAMSYASLVIPVAAAYIAYVWNRMSSRPLTPEDLTNSPGY
ncbi:MAG: cytochrome d ubiquinol oxidase subunit II [Bacteroides sp.]|nr:cytochrome d ubiquinol oxidase subunit II [Bacteroides sp.]MCM1380177.1 cytochrome d ubiquinol oxidase subunit II [Bacteroides sp.]MCM1446508.1 cytochrome d ubiquinol oxidase subunit II [Prevotella sp.]